MVDTQHKFAPVVLCSCSLIFFMQVVQINKLPLVISFIGSVSCNTGQILLLEQHIEPLLSDLRMAVAES